MNLDAGLHLEDRDIYLEWRFTFEELLLTRPDYCTARKDSTQKSTLAWNDRIIGLPCQIATTFEPSQSNPSGFRILFQCPRNFNTMSSAFEWLNRELAGRVGHPPSVYDDGECGKALWYVGHVAMRHEYFAGMGGGDFLLIYPERSSR